MIGWLRRRGDARVERQADAILTALGDGTPHYVYRDLDQATGIPASRMYPALIRLETQGRVESGLPQTSPGRHRRWYRLAEEVTQ